MGFVGIGFGLEVDEVVGVGIVGLDGFVYVGGG